MKSTYIGLAELKHRAELAIREALEEAGDAFLEEVRAVEPEDTGAMIESTEIGPVTGGMARGFRRRLIVGKYYGRWQHEKNWYHHAHGRAKFVSGPLLGAGAQLLRALAAAARRQF